MTAAIISAAIKTNTPTTMPAIMPPLLFVFVAFGCPVEKPRGNDQNNDNDNDQEHPPSIFGKYLFGRRFEIENFRNICCKISCLPACPRIFEHLRDGTIAHF